MNINSQELMLVRRNLRFGEEPAPQKPEAQVTEPPVTKPESGLSALRARNTEPPVSEPESELSALEAQAHSNIAFQGVQGVAKTTLAKIRNNAASYLLAGAMAATVPMMTSCVKTESWSYSESKVDMEQFYKLMEEQNQLLSQILERLGLSNELLAQIRDLTAQNGDYLKTLVDQGKLTAEQAAAFQNMLTNALNTIITNQEKNNATDEEILKNTQDIKGYIQFLASEVAAGRMSMEEARAEFAAYLEQINATLGSILAVVTEISEKITANHNEYMAARDEELVILNKLHQDNKLEALLLAQLLKSNKNLEELAKQLNTSVELLRLELMNNHEEIMNELKNLTPGEELYQKYEALFKALGLTITDAINMSKDELLAAIKAFQESTSQDAATIQAQIAKLGEQLNVIIKNTSGLQEHFEQQKNFWANALGNMEKGNQILDDIRKEQKATNKHLESFKAYFEKMIASQEQSNAYLIVMNNSILSLEKAINELEGGSGMTREEFISAMRELQPEFAAAFEAFIEKYNFDNVPGDVQTIKDLLSELKDAYKNQKDYSSQLDRIINLETQIFNLLENADFSDPSILEKLDTLIEKLNNFKCDCDCNKDSGKTDESVEDLEDLFGNGNQAMIKSPLKGIQYGVNKYMA